MHESERDHLLTKHQGPYAGEVVAKWRKGMGRTPDETSYDLLPLFRACHGAMLRPEVLLIQLQLPQKPGQDWELFVDGIRQRDVRFRLSTLLRRDIGQCVMEEVVCELLERCLDLDIADALGIFNESAMALLVHGERNAQAERRYVDDAQAATSKFSLDCARLIAKELASEIDLVPGVIDRLKNHEAFITGGERRTLAQSLWDEIVLEMLSPTVEQEVFKQLIESAARKAFARLPRAKQLAIWICHSDTYDCIDNVATESPESDLETFELFDSEPIFDSIAREVFGMAMEEAEKRADL